MEICLEVDSVCVVLHVFQNTSLLVDNTWPQFTDCFRHTVLIWLPCAFLFLMLPYYVTSVRQRATDIEFKITALFGARLVSL